MNVQSKVGLSTDGFMMMRVGKKGHFTNKNKNSCTSVFVCHFKIKDARRLRRRRLDNRKTPKDLHAGHSSDDLLESLD